MLNAAVKPFVKLVERYLPDPYIFVLLLTAIAFITAIVVEDQHPLAVISYWGNGFWDLLAFSMQMLLVLITGFMLASTALIRRILERLAALASTPGRAIILVSLVSLVASWINWGFGLVVGALFAKTLARRTAVDYRLLVASAFSGFVIWHGGLSGSVPLTIATPGHFLETQMGLIEIGDTLFSTFNIAIVLLLMIAVPLVNWLMLPPQDESVLVDPAQLEEPPSPVADPSRPAERLENSRWLALPAGLLGLIYIARHFSDGGSLNLNTVNFLFLFLAILLHGTPRNLLHSLQQAIQGGAGIVLQFPFYAGIMAIMAQSGLAHSLSVWFVSIATEATLPLLTFISAGIVNIFIPSGGGQWAIQAPVMIPAAAELGAEINRVAMAVAWGDAWTNLIQPFWALPVLAIAGLRAKDIMGFCLLQLIITGIIIGFGLTFF